MIVFNELIATSFHPSSPELYTANVSRGILLLRLRILCRCPRHVNGLSLHRITLSVFDSSSPSSSGHRPWSNHLHRLCYQRSEYAWLESVDKLHQSNQVCAYRVLREDTPDRLSYAFESLMVNEFHDQNYECSAFVPTGPGYEAATGLERVCSTIGSTPGSPVVNGDAYINQSYSYYHAHKWRNIGIMFVFMIGFLIVYLVATGAFLLYPCSCILWSSQ